MATTIRRRTLPGTELDLSVISLGTVSVGGVIDEDQSLRLLDAYAEAGGNFLDTAEIYSNWIDGVPPSTSERRIGTWLRSRGVEKEVIVATKGGHPRWGSLGVMRLGHEEVMADLHASLDRLGLDCIPLYYVHRDDPARPVEQIMDTLAEAAGQGLVRHVGCSNWTAERVDAAQRYAREKGRPGFVIDQMRWSLATVNAESQRIPGLVEMDDALHEYHATHQLPAAAYSSQAQGFFSGAYGRNVEHPDTRAGEKVKTYYYNDTNFERLERVMAVAERIGRPPTQVALGYLMAQPFATWPIIGPSSVEHLEESIAAHDVELEPEQLLWLRTGARA